MTALHTLMLAASLWGGLGVPNASAQGNAAPPPELIRLDPAVQPKAAQLSLVLDPAQPTHRGELQLDLVLERPAASLVLHARGLQLGPAFVESGAHRLTAQVQRLDAERVRLRLNRPAAAGPARLSIAFSGRLGEPVAENLVYGLFRQAEAGRWFAFSRFEPRGARQAFPLLDEPGFKLPWTLRLTVPAGLQALANTPVQRQTPADAPAGWQTWHFAPTPPLPGHLLAIAVGPFELQAAPTVNGTPLRVAGPPGLAREAAPIGPPVGPTIGSLSAQLLGRLESALGTPLPGAQLDSVVMPSAPTAARALSQPGLVLYPPAPPLAPAEPNGTPEDRWAALIAPALARQWFGQLVSPSWWDEAWLGEALARWQGAQVRDLPPQARIAQARQWREQALNPGPAETWRDGGEARVARAMAGLTMLDGTDSQPGSTRLQPVLRRYLERHAWGTAGVAEFGAVLAEAEPRAAASFNSLTAQPDMPLLHVALSCAPNAPPQLRLQAGSLATPGSPAKAAPASVAASPAWVLPLQIRSPAGSQRLWLDTPEARIDLPDTTCPAWVQANAGGLGVYRVVLADAPGGAAAAWFALAQAPGLGPAEALALADDSAALHPVGELGHAELLAVARGLGTRAGAIPSSVAEAAQGLLNGLIPLAQAGGADEAATLAVHWQASFGARAHALGWLPRPEDDADAHALRALLLPALAGPGQDTDLRAQALDLVRGALAGRHELPAALRPALLAAAAETGDAALFDLYTKHLDEARTPTERQPLWSALGRFNTPDLAERARALLLAPALPMAEGLEPLLQAQAAQGPAARETVLDFLARHGPVLLRRLGSNTEATAAALRWPALFQTACRPEEANRLRERLAGLLPPLPGGAQVLAQADARIQACSALRSQLGPLPPAPVPVRATPDSRLPRLWPARL